MKPVNDHVSRILDQWGRERPDLDASPMAIFGRMTRLADALGREISAVQRRFGLGEGEFDVLATLRRAGEPYERAPGELAEHTMVTTGAMSRSLLLPQFDRAPRPRPEGRPRAGRVQCW